MNCCYLRCLLVSSSNFVLSLGKNEIYDFEARHPRCVSNKSNYKVYAYIVKHNYVLGGMLFM